MVERFSQRIVNALLLYLLPNCGKKYHTWTLNKKGGNIWTGFIQLGISASHRFCEHSNEPVGFTKDGYYTPGCTESKLRIQYYKL
jgi:hypothetical protein